MAARVVEIPGERLKVRFGKNYQVATPDHIWHSEGPARSRKLFKKTFGALAPGGTIAIMEFLVNEQRTDPPVPLFLP